MLANLGRGLARLVCQCLTRLRMGRFLCLLGRYSRPWGVSCYQVHGRGLVVQQMSKIAARFVDLFIELNTRKEALLYL